MLRFIPVLALLLFTACGLAENEQDDKNKRIYITFTDPAFEQFCLGMFDLDHDGRISRYEAQRVLVMDCSGRNISGCEVTFANLLNTYDVLNADKLVVDKAALQKIEEVFA